MQDLTPRLIEAAELKILGIEQGWYGVKSEWDNHNGAIFNPRKMLGDDRAVT